MQATDFAREMSCMDMKMEKYNKLSYLHNSLQTSVIARITQKVEAMPSMSENECDTFIKTITASLGYVLRGNEYMSNRIKDCPCPRDKMCLYGIWFIKNKLAAIDNALMKLKEKPNVQQNT